MVKDYYKILEVNESASTEVINAAYKTLVKRYHPDLARETEKRMKEEKMKELNLAKDILTDPAKRSRYDIELKREKEKQIQQEIAERAKNISQTYIKNNQNDSNNTNNNNKKEPPKKKKAQDTPTSETPLSMMFGSFKSFFSLFGNFNENKKLIIICSGIFLIAFLQIFLVLGYTLKTPTNTQTLNQPGVSQIKNNGLVKMEVGLPKHEVIRLLGSPDAEYSAYLKYGDAKILLQDNYVIGWIDTYEQLPIIRHTKVPTSNTLKVGSSKDYVFETFGTPDTYSRDLFVYDDVIIYFEKDIVVGVEYIQK